MKNGLKIMTVAMAFAIAGMISCQKEKANNQPEAVLVPYEGAPEVKSDFEPKVIATVQSEHSEIEFIEVADQEVVMLEILSAESSKIGKLGVLENPQKSSAFDVFVKITKSNVSVPQIIANTADQSVVVSSNRKIDATNSPMSITSERFVAPRGCSNLSFISFLNTYCDYPLDNNPNNIEFCDAEIWDTHARTSFLNGNWEKANFAQYKTEVRCGSVTVRAYKWNTSSGGFWDNYFSRSITNGVSVLSTPSITKKYLKISRTKQGGNGFRAYTRFVD